MSAGGGDAGRCVEFSSPSFDLRLLLECEYLLRSWLTVDVVLVNKGFGMIGSVTARFFIFAMAGLGEANGIAGCMYPRFLRAVRGFPAGEGEASGVGGIGLFSY